MLWHPTYTTYGELPDKLLDIIMKLGYKYVYIASIGDSYSNPNFNKSDEHPWHTTAHIQEIDPLTPLPAHQHDQDAI